MISGYDHPVYNQKLAGWRKSSFQGITRGGPRTETVWMNFAEPAELHDYRYLGRDYREREAIKKQKKRWTAKLQAMPLQRRYALMSALEDFFAEVPASSLAGNGGTAGVVPDASPEMTVLASTADNGDAIEHTATNGDAGSAGFFLTESGREPITTNGTR